MRLEGMAGLVTGLHSTCRKLHVFAGERSIRFKMLKEAPVLREGKPADGFVAEQLALWSCVQAII